MRAFIVFAVNYHRLAPDRKNTLKTKVPEQAEPDHA